MRNMPPRDDRQTLMFSATFKPDIQKLAAEFLREYVWVGVGRVGSTVENIKQVILQSSSDLYDKLNLTLEAIKQTKGQTLVFVQKKRTASWLRQTLRYQYQLLVDEIHSDKSQGQRESSLRRFRDGQTKILVGTDVAARGLDIANIGHVIQFDLPFSSDEFDTYIHRMGRTGRAGHSGLATSLFVPGTVSGEGNGRIAPLIMQLLEENNQEIPDWFREVHDKQLVTGKRGGKKGGNKFGSQDVRVPHGQKQNTQYVGGGNRGHRQQHQQGGGYMRGGVPAQMHQGYLEHGQGHGQYHQPQYHMQQQQYPQQRAYVPQQGYGMHGVPPHMEHGGYHPQMMAQMGYPPNASNYPPNGQGVPPPPEGNGQMQYPSKGQEQDKISQNQSAGESSSQQPPDQSTDTGGESPGSTHKTKRPPSLDVPQNYPPQGMNMNMTPGSYGMPVHFMPPSPSPNGYPAPSPHFMMPPTPSGYNYSPRTYNPSITSPSHVMRVDASQMRVEAPSFVPGPSIGQQQSPGEY
jgi:superfamily II DNA/RNA helicase